MTSSLPLALGIALSPFAILPAILVLLGPRGRAAGYAFAGAWWLGTAVVAIAVGSLAFAAPGDDKPTWAAILRIVVGAGLLVLAGRKWKGRATATSPAWLDSLGEATPASAAKLGLLLTVANPKVLMLAGAGGASIGATAPTFAAELAATALFALVASSTVLAPVVAATVGGRRATPVLESLRRWLDAHTATLLAVVTAVIGALVLYSGISGI
jgi:threonine/homoserine/homoserine lactone efflux protein